MKIKFENVNLEKIKEVRDLANEVLEMNFEEMEYSEKNIQKASEMINKYNCTLLKYKNFWNQINASLIKDNGTPIIRLG